MQETNDSTHAIHIDLTGDLIEGTSKADGEMLKADNTLLKEQVSDLQSKLAELITTVASLQTNVASQEQKLSEASDKIASLSDEMSSSKLAQEALQGTINEKFASVDGSLSSLASKTGLFILRADSSSAWKAYGVDGITIDIDYSDLKLDYVPKIFTSLSGDSYHWATTGATSIYNPSKTGPEG